MASRFSLHAAGDIEITTQATHTISNPQMTAGRLYLLGFVCDKGSNAAVADPTCAQTGYTWAAVPSTLPAGYGTSGRSRIAVFRCQPTQAQIDANPGTTTVTITTGADTTTRRAAAIICTNDDVFDDSANNGVGAIVQAEGTTTGSNVGTISETLTSAVTAGNSTCGFSGWITGTTGTQTPGTGFTQLEDVATASGTTINVMLLAEGWDDSNGQADNVIDASKDSGTNRVGIIGIEVKFDPPAGGATLYLGDTAVDTLYIGDTEVDALYLGDTLIWSQP